MDLYIQHRDEWECEVALQHEDAAQSDATEESTSPETTSLEGESTA